MNIDKPGISEFQERLEGFCNRAFDIANEHRTNGRGDGLAFYYYGRLVSCFMGVKTLLYALDKASSEANFGVTYVYDVLPANLPVKNVEWGKRYISETYMAIRFVLFQNFYSQTEFTYRIIQRKKFPLSNTNPFKLAAQEYDIMNINFVTFINSIRNTIHNNGFYFPTPQIEKFEHTFKGKLFTFEYGKRIDNVTMENILQIIEYLIEENNELFKSEELSTINFEQED